KRATTSTGTGGADTAWSRGSRPDNAPEKAKSSSAAPNTASATIRTRRVRAERTRVYSQEHSPVRTELRPNEAGRRGPTSAAVIRTSSRAVGLQRVGDGARP